MGESIRIRPKDFFVSTHKVIQHYWDECGLRRMQMTVDANNPVTNRWAKGLRFHKEGLMKNYGIDGDYYMYGRYQ